MKNKYWQRNPGNRHKRRRICLVVEGARTEAYYFDALKAAAREAGWHLTVQSCGGGSQKQILDKAIAQIRLLDLRGGDECWCVFDFVGPVGGDKPITQMVADAERCGVKVCLSNPCFEVWLLMHFQRWARPLHGAEEARIALSEKWRDQFNRPFDKSDHDGLIALAAEAQRAISNAQWVLEQHPSHDVMQSNPSTDVFRVAKRLLNASL